MHTAVGHIVAFTFAVIDVFGCGAVNEGSAYAVYFFVTLIAFFCDAFSLGAGTANPTGGIAGAIKPVTAAVFDVIGLTITIVQVIIRVAFYSGGTFTV